MSSRPDVVLVHGMIISGNYMMPLAKQLADDYSVLVPDLPGYGHSYKPKEILSIPQLADSVIAWMDAQDLNQAHFIANSFGCQIIADLAARHPERVQSLVLQGPTVDAHARHILLQALRLKINSFRESKSVGMISAHDYKAAGPKRVLKTISMTIRDHIEDKLPKISAPTLIVRGERDPVVPQSWAEEVLHLLPHGRLTIIPNAAHTLNYSEPGRFAEVIKMFLTELESKGKHESTQLAKTPASHHRPSI